MKTICQICGNEFRIRPNRKGKAKYCSRKCYTESMKLNLDEQEIIRLYLDEKISSLQIAKKFNCSDKPIRDILNRNNIIRHPHGFFLLGVPSPIKGRHTHTEASRKEMSVSRLGEKNPMYGKKGWNKGLTKETDERVKQTSEKLTGRKLSEEHRLKAIKNLRPPQKSEINRLKEIIRDIKKQIKLNLYNKIVEFKKGNIPENKEVYIHNKIVECTCGCGQTMNYLNKYGRPRKFIWGHNHKGKDYISIYGESKAKSLIESKTGEKHWNWKDGKSFEPYGLDFNDKFKESIRERDNNCCVICNKMQEELGEKLSVHHIDYDKTNSFPQNCVSLCRGHHIITNNNRESWKAFFQKLLSKRYNYEYTQDQKIILDFTKNEI